MIQGQAFHQDAADLLATIIEVIRADFGPERPEPDREIIRFHLAGQELVKAIVALPGAVDQETISRHIRRTEEGKALDVVPVRVAEEQVSENGRFTPGHQVGAQFADSRAGIANEQLIAASNFNAGSVAAVFACPVARGRDGPAHAPELHVNFHLYSSQNSNTKSASWTMSPSRKTAERTLIPLRKTPFRLSKSWIETSWGRQVIRACRRDTLAEGNRTSAFSSRPTTISGLFKTNRLGAPAPSSCSRKGLRARRPTR